MTAYELRRGDDGGVEKDSHMSAYGGGGGGGGDGGGVRENIF